MSMFTLPFGSNKLIQLCRQNDVLRLGVFGSVVRGEATDQSDIDLLVEFSKPKSLLKFVALERQMTELLGKKVDLLTQKSLSPYIKPFVDKQKKIIYERR